MEDIERINITMTEGEYELFKEAKSDAIKCQVFLNTLSSSAQKWFDRLSNGSITYFFHDFKTIFLRHFTSSRKYQKTDHCLFTLKQGSTEPLRSYVKHFNQVAQDVSSVTSEILMSVFSHGLVEGEFFRALIREPVKNFDEMVGKATSYISVEEAQVARRKEDKALAPANKPEKRLPNRRLSLFRMPGILDRDSRPGKTLGSLKGSYTHATGDCVQFARDSWWLAKLGLPPPKIAPKLQRLLANQQAMVSQSSKSLLDNAGQGSQQPGHGKERGESLEEENRGNATIREIGMISRGPMDGDSVRAQKSHERHLEIHVVGCNRKQVIGPIIIFGPQDLEGLELPHDDALIIKAFMANSCVARVFVDTGSSVNMVFKSAFKCMQIDAREL
ncbi:uncharacterized protein LOC121990798 [Zingiber officinale]|uniref:uncharacterized protein LOC121990798 n=1 Tax=Zingiber officinale TaxID=94328 RepID=UPI001C4CF22D|nr:uncharacterized protein LOC121990798 [Zingiber officinale]